MLNYTEKGREDERSLWKRPLLELFRQRLHVEMELGGAGSHVGKHIERKHLKASVTAVI